MNNSAAYDNWRTTDYAYEKAQAKADAFSAECESIVEDCMSDFDQYGKDEIGGDLFTLFTEELAVIDNKDERRVIEDALNMIRKTSPAAWAIIRKYYEQMATANADVMLNKKYDSV